MKRFYVAALSAALLSAPVILPIASAVREHREKIDIPVPPSFQKEKARVGDLIRLTMDNSAEWLVEPDKTKTVRFNDGRELVLSFSDAGYYSVLAVAVANDRPTIKRWEFDVAWRGPTSIWAKRIGEWSDADWAPLAPAFVEVAHILEIEMANGKLMPPEEIIALTKKQSQQLGISPALWSDFVTRATPFFAEEIITMTDFIRVWREISDALKNT